MQANMTVIEYVTEEVQRQGHDTSRLDGIERVGWMLNVWGYALRQDDKPTVSDILMIGRLIEPEKNPNPHTPRRCNVRVGSRNCPPWEQVERLLRELIKKRDSLEPLEFYRGLLEIHPFVDGNGRTGKVVLNWLNGTLLNPIFPPDDFWGYPIRNP